MQKKNAKIRLGDVYPRAQEKYTAKKKKKWGGGFSPRKTDRQTLWKEANRFYYQRYLLGRYNLNGILY